VTSCETRVAVVQYNTPCKRRCGRNVAMAAMAALLSGPGWEGFRIGPPGRPGRARVSRIVLLRPVLALACRRHANVMAASAGDPSDRYPEDVEVMRTQVPCSLGDAAPIRVNRYTASSAERTCTFKFEVPPHVVQVQACKAPHRIGRRV